MHLLKVCGTNSNFAGFVRESSAPVGGPRGCVGPVLGRMFVIKAFVTTERAFSELSGLGRRPRFLEHLTVSFQTLWTSVLGRIPLEKVCSDGCRNVCSASWMAQRKVPEHFLLPQNHHTKSKNVPHTLLSTIKILILKRCVFKTTSILTRYRG